MGFRSVSLFTAALLVTPAATPCAAAGSPLTWTSLEPGLELGRFERNTAPSGGNVSLVVLRVDTSRWDLVLRSISGTGEPEGRSVRDWCLAEGFAAAVNSGMFQQDFRTHVGYLEYDGHVNNPAPNGYLSAAAMDPREEGDAPFRIFDLDVDSLDEVRAGYRSVVQNLRLVKKPGVNRWRPQEKRWRGAVLGEDSAGRALIVFSEGRLSMHELNEMLLSLPLGLVAAQHLEGGPQAQFYVAAGGTEVELTGGHGSVPFPAEGLLSSLPVPNVLGVRRRAGGGDEAPAARTGQGGE